MSVYIIDKCERFVSQRAGCGKAARPEFCEGCTTVRGAPTRPIKDTLVVINADDYYGKEGFKKVHEYLVNGGTSCVWL